jgi:hypothetical protein
MSTQSLCDLFKTSHYTIENQLKLLCELKLINKVVKTNRKNTISRVRELTIPSNFAKTMEKLLKEKDKKQAQNFEVPSRSKRKNLSDLQPTNFEVASTPEASANFDVKQPTNSHQSNPQILRNNNINDGDKLNNKLLEDNFMSSLSSSDDDFRNEKFADSSFVSVASNDALNDTYNNTGGEQNSMGNRNAKNDEMTEWFNTCVNPIARYEYELKYKQSAQYFAYGNKCLPDVQIDYYTPEEIFEWFSKENQLWYLHKINWKHCDNINWKWLIDIDVQKHNELNSSNEN